jgi:ATP-binding cassette subfamily B protein
MLSFLKYPAKYWPWYLFGIVALLATNIITSLIPRKLEEAVNHLQKTNTNPEMIWHILWGIVILALGLMLVRTLSRIFIFFPGRFVEFDLRNDLFAKLLTQPSPFYRKHKTGTLMSCLMNDIQSLRLMVGFGFLHILNTAGLYIFIVYQMLQIDTRLTLFVLLPIPIFLCVCANLVMRIYTNTFQNQVKLGHLTDFIGETLSNISMLKSFNAESSFERLFEEHNQDYQKSNLHMAKLRAQMFPLIAVMTGVGHLILFSLGGNAVIHGTLNLGQFVAFSAYITILSWPTAAMGWIVNVMQRGISSLKRVQEILEENPLPRDTEKQKWKEEEAIKTPPSIEMKNLSFRFQDENANGWILKEVSFQADPGTVLGIFGPTGAGKSVLANLLTGIEEAPAKTLFFNGIPLEEWPLEQFRAMTAYVNQNSFLFSETIAENIAYGRPLHKELPDGALVAAAAVSASLDSDIEDFPDRYTTLIGERGILLSGGQKKRTILARAFYKTHCFLVLDDVLSAVDHRTEKKLIENILKRRKDLTTILISHRVAALTHCDQILVLEHGRITARGTHTALIEKEGIYRDTYRYQITEKEKE